jgi:hypothetical protein
MRIWAIVYDSDGLKVAQIDRLISANTSSRLDEAGTFDLQCALDADVINYLISGNEVALFAQEDEETPLQWTRGKIVKPRNQETADNVSISRAGRDQLNELNFRTVGLGRSYSAQTVETIIDDLVELVPSWSADVDTAVAALLKTGRYDGSKVLRAISQSCKQWGLHFRLGTDSRTLEVGAFGVAATTDSGDAIWAVQVPSSIEPRLYSRDDLLFIDTISVTEDSDPILNWAIPMGAGEGTAATTLKDTSYEILNSDNTVYRAGSSTPYPIYRRVNDFGIAEYYVDASDGDEQHQDTLSFKNIGPIANSSTAKILASNALANATFATLTRTREALTSYTLSVRKMRVNVRPGDLIYVQYKGMVSTPSGRLTYIDVDEYLWVMSVQHSASESGFTHTLQVSTIDRHVMDETDILIEVLDRTETRNVSIQTFPNTFTYVYTDTIGWNGGNKTASFRLKFKDYVTDIISVRLSFRTFPLDATTSVADLSPFEYFWTLQQSYNYPSDITVEINGIDRSVALGAPSGAWNFGGTNAALDVADLDITEYIVDAIGGMFQTHSIEFNADTRVGEVKYSSSFPSVVQSTASAGKVEAVLEVLTTCRAIF